MKLSINLAHRAACERAHTATHLLHAELGKIFPQTKQAWSYVGPDELRFDFFTDRSLTEKELQDLGRVINTLISENEKVSVQEMLYVEALQTGAKAFFEDSYPEMVRVVSIGSAGNTNYSVELCWGTHVNYTGQIGSFVITEQSAVAAGTKRITAITGPKVSSYVREIETHLSLIAQKIGVPVKQMESKIDKILIETEQMKEKIEKLWSWLIQSIPWTSKDIWSIIVDGYWVYDSDIASLGLSFTDCIVQLKEKFPEKTFLLVNQEGQYALFHPQAKIASKELGLKGGGSGNFIQGKDIKIVS